MTSQSQYAAVVANKDEDVCFACKGGDSPMCPTCVKDAMGYLLELQGKSLKERNQLRKQCKEEIKRCNNYTSSTSTINTNKSPTAAELKMQVDRLRQKLSNLVYLCNSTAVECDKISVTNELRTSFLSQCHDKLHRTQTAFTDLYESDGTGLVPALSTAIRDTLTMSRNSRFKLAIQAFHMHRIDVGKDNNASSSTSTARQQTQPRGIGKIGGLPLPHAGPILYGCLPPEVLTSALRFVASLTHTLSHVLCISLPHPILLRPSGTNPSINNTNEEEEHVTMRTYYSYWNHHCDNTSILPRKQTVQPKINNGQYIRNGIYNDNETSQAPPPNVVSSEQQQPNNSNSSNLATATTGSGISGKEEQQQTPVWSVRNTLTKVATGALSRASKLLIDGNVLTNNLSSAATTTAFSDSSSCSTTTTINRSHETNGSKHLVELPPSHLQKRAMDSQSIQQRIRYGTATFIQESSSSTATTNEENQQQRRTAVAAAEFELNADADTEDFSIGLQLLQNDIVALCIHSGVPVATLWPAEAILLNLNALWTYCCSQITATTNNNESTTTSK